MRVIYLVNDLRISEGRHENPWLCEHAGMALCGGSLHTKQMSKAAEGKDSLRKWGVHRNYIGVGFCILG